MLISTSGMVSYMKKNISKKSNLTYLEKKRHPSMKSSALDFRTIIEDHSNISDKIYFSTKARTRLSFYKWFLISKDPFIRSQLIESKKIYFSPPWQKKHLYFIEFLTIPRKLLNSQKKLWITFLLSLKFCIYWYICDPCRMIRNWKVDFKCLGRIIRQTVARVTIITNLRKLKHILLWTRKL